MFGLGFLAPAFLAGALAVAIPVLLHLFRRRTDRVVDFPAIQMLPPAPAERQERRRLRDLLLLALRIAALVLLAGSFARPYVMSGAEALRPPMTVVAVDTSLSMSAPATWTAARRAALRAVDGAAAADLVSVVTFDDRGQVAVAPTANRAEARAYLETLTPGAGGTRFATGVGAAVEALATSRGRIVVVTDLQHTGLSPGDAVAVPDGIDVSVASVPAAPANLAVIALTREANGLTAVVQSFAHGPRTVMARLRVGEAELRSQRVELAPLASTEVRFPGPLPSAGVAQVSIDDLDGFVADNRRYASLDPARPRTLLVLTADPPESARTGLYVQRALEATDDATLRVTVADGRRLAAATAGSEPPGAIFVIGTRTLNREARAWLASYLRDGGRVFLSLGPDVDVPSLTDVLGVTVRLAPEPVDATGAEAAIVASDGRHPVLRRLAGPASSLGRVPIERYRRVLDEAGWDVLARFAGGALAVAERVVGRGTLLMFASDLDNRWNRFPLEPSFAPFMVETARYLTRGTESASEFVLPQVPPGVPAVPGPHPVPADATRAARLVVVNVNPVESDPAATSAAALLASLGRVEGARAAPAVEEARAREEQQRLWQRGLLIMLGVLVMESLVGRVRRAGRIVEPKVG